MFPIHYKTKYIQEIAKPNKITVQYTNLGEHLKNVIVSNVIYLLPEKAWGEFINVKYGYHLG